MRHGNWNHFMYSKKKLKNVHVKHGLWIKRPPSCGARPRLFTFVFCNLFLAFPFSSHPSLALVYTFLFGVFLNKQKVKSDTFLSVSITRLSLSFSWENLVLSQNNVVHLIIVCTVDSCRLNSVSKVLIEVTSSLGVKKSETICKSLKRHDIGRLIYNKLEKLSYKIVSRCDDSLFFDRRCTML